MKARCVDCIHIQGFLCRDFLSGRGLFGVAGTRGIHGVLLGMLCFGKEAQRGAKGVYPDIHDRAASGLDAGKINNTAQKRGL